MLRTLLVPLDGSDLAETALPWGVTLAREKHVSLMLARVVRAAGGAHAVTPAPGTNGADGVDAEVAQTYLDAVRERLGGEGVEATAVVCEGSPAEALLDLADRSDASAIVIATSGHGSVLDYPLARVAERILQEAAVPVLLVPTGREAVRRPPALRRLLIPLDGSALAERALDMAVEIAARDATLVFTQVVEPSLGTLDTAEGGLPLEDTAATERARSEAAAYLQGLRHDTSESQIVVQTSVAVGVPDRQVLAMAREFESDLIVMVTHGASGPGRGWLGSVANAVVRRTDVPVFLISARALVARVGRSYRVGDVMTRDVAVVRADEPLDAVLRRLIRRRISGAPVVQADGTLIGVITEHDLLEWQLAALRAHADEPSMIPHAMAAACAGEVMSHLAVSVEESMPLASVLPMLLELPYRRLPVTRDGRLIGVVSRADVLKAMAEQDTTAIRATFVEPSAAPA